MMMKTLRWIAPSLAFVAGCASVSAGNAPTLAASDALCRQVSDWESGGNTQARRITPVVNEDDGGRSYHFDLGGRGRLQALDASCGWGSYAECNFTAREQQGGAYEFTDFSTFALWEDEGELYLVYKIVSPKDEAAARKRRVLKIASPPNEICNQIGDYSKLM